MTRATRPVLTLAGHPADPVEVAIAARTATRDRFWRHVDNTRNKTRTADVYVVAVDALGAWLTHRRDDRGFVELDTDSLDEFLSDYRRGRNGFRPHAESTTNQISRSLKSFYRYLAARPGSDGTNPMTATAPRPVGEVNVEDKVLTDDQLAAVLATVAHRRDFASVRDHAMLRLLLTGIRRGELAALTLADFNLTDRTVRVEGKGDRLGSRHRLIPIGGSTIEALDDYLELRERHPLAHRPDLWVGKRGVITGRGIHQIVRKRGEQAGIDGVYPHMFRHTAAHRWLADDGSEGNLMVNMGWKSREMVDRYAASTRGQRARDEYRRRALDERI